MCITFKEKSFNLSRAQVFVCVIRNTPKIEKFQLASLVIPYQLDKIKKCDYNRAFVMRSNFVVFDLQQRDELILWMKNNSSMYAAAYLAGFSLKLDDRFPKELKISNTINTYILKNESKIKSYSNKSLSTSNHEFLLMKDKNYNIYGIKYKETNNLDSAECIKITNEMDCEMDKLNKTNRPFGIYSLGIYGIPVVDKTFNSGSPVSIKDFILRFDNIVNFFENETCVYEDAIVNNCSENGDEDNTVSKSNENNENKDEQGVHIKKHQQGENQLSDKEKEKERENTYELTESILLAVCIGIIPVLVLIICIYLYRDKFQENYEKNICETECEIKCE